MPMYEDFLEYVKKAPRSLALTSPTGFKNFKASIDKISTHNANPSKTYEMGVSEYTDMSWEEFQEHFGLNEKQECSATLKGNHVSHSGPKPT